MPLINIGRITIFLGRDYINEMFYFLQIFDCTLL